MKLYELALAVAVFVWTGLSPGRGDGIARSMRCGRGQLRRTAKFLFTALELSHVALIGNTDSEVEICKVRVRTASISLIGRW